MKAILRKNFTLIELILVVAIVAILAGAMIPVINGARQKARIAKAMQLADNMRTVCQQFNADTGGFAHQIGGGAFNSQLVLNPGIPGWDGPYIPRHFTADDNPFSSHRLGVDVRGIIFGPTDFDLDGNGVNDRSGPGNFIQFWDISEDEAKELNDMYDANVPGDWRHTGRVEYWVAGTRMATIYLIGGN